MGNGLKRELLSVNGRAVLSYLPIAGESPIADLAEVTVDSVDEVVPAVLDQLPGWRIASRDHQFAEALVLGGCKMLRHAHLFTLNLRTFNLRTFNSTTQQAERLVEKFSSLTFAPLDDCDRELLVDVSLAAYPDGHPDAETQDRTVVHADIDALLSGVAVGPFVPGASELALDVTDTGAIPVGLVIINEMPGEPPNGGAWVSEVCRSPAAQYSGLGPLMLARAVRHLVSDGRWSLSLVVTEGNPARSTYERLGFQFVSTSWKLQIPGVPS